MIRLIKALGVAKTVAAVSVLTAATAFAAHTALPVDSTQGQTHAAAAAANATTAHVDARGGTDKTAGTDATTGTRADVHAILLANKARLLANFQDVLARLKANGANQHAIDAIQRHITDLTTGTSGLDRAMAAVAGSGGADQALKPLLPGAALGHGRAGNHPTTP